MNNYLYVNSKCAGTRLSAKTDEIENAIAINNEDVTQGICTIDNNTVTSLEFSENDESKSIGKENEPIAHICTIPNLPRPNTSDVLPIALQEVSQATAKKELIPGYEEFTKLRNIAEVSLTNKEVLIPVIPRAGQMSSGVSSFITPDCDEPITRNEDVLYKHGSENIVPHGKDTKSQAVEDFNKPVSKEVVSLIGNAENDGIDNIHKTLESINYLNSEYNPEPQQEDSDIHILDLNKCKSLQEDENGLLQDKGYHDVCVGNIENVNVIEDNIEEEESLSGNETVKKLNDSVRGKIAKQLKSLSLSNIYVNNLYKYISKENVFKMLLYGEEIGLIDCKGKTVHSLGWKVKQLRILKKELTGIDDNASEGQQKKGRPSRFGKRKRKKSQLTVAQARRLAKKRLKEFDETGDSGKDARDKNALARALDLRVNRYFGELEDVPEERNEPDSNIIEINYKDSIQAGRGRRKSKLDLDTENVIMNVKRSCRGRTQKTDLQEVETESEPEDSGSEKNKVRRATAKSVTNNTDNGQVSKVRRSSYTNLTISPSSKSKKKIKAMIDKFEVVGLNDLTPKNLHQSLSKSQVTEYLEFGKWSQFIEFDSMKQNAIWKLEQLKLLRDKIVDYILKVKQHEAEYKRMRRQDPEYRDRERQRNKEAKRKLRQDPEYRKQELINMTRARQLAKFRKLQLEFIEQEELMIERRSNEVILDENNDQFEIEIPDIISLPKEDSESHNGTNTPIEANTCIPMEVDTTCSDTLECQPIQSVPAHHYNPNNDTAHFEILGENSNMQNNLHVMAPKEFMEPENSHHELKDNTFVSRNHTGQTHCTMMTSMQGNIMQSQQTHPQLLVPVSGEMSHQNDFVPTSGMVQIHLQNREHQPQHRMVMEHSDYSCMNRDNVYHHEMVQNKFTHRPDSHSTMSDHNVSFTSLLIQDQLLDCELHGDHE